MRPVTRPVPIAHVVQNLDVGGLERVVINLMQATDPERFRPILYPLGDGGALAAGLADAGFGVRPMRKRPGVDWFLLPRLAWQFRRDRVRLVHCHNHSPLVYGSIAGRLAGAGGVVYTAHGAKTAGRQSTRRFQSLGLVDEIVFVSDDARRVALAAGAASERGTRTIHNGVDADAFVRDDAVRERTRQALGIAPATPVAGIVARLTRAKDHVNLFEAFAQVRERYPDARCVVVGDGELRGALEREVETRGLRDAVMMLGRRDDVADLLCAFDVFVLSSSTEGLALILLEAMAAGLPVVATRVGGNPEVVVDGVTGRVVPPRDPGALAGAVASLFADPATARRMGQAGRERSRGEFSTRTMADRYAATYEALLHRTGQE